MSTCGSVPPRPSVVRDETFRFQINCILPFVCIRSCQAKIERYLAGNHRYRCRVGIFVNWVILDWFFCRVSAKSVFVLGLCALIGRLRFLILAMRLRRSFLFCKGVVLSCSVITVWPNRRIFPFDVIWRLREDLHLGRVFTWSAGLADPYFWWPAMQTLGDLSGWTFCRCAALTFIWVLDSRSRFCVSGA